MKKFLKIFYKINIYFNFALAVYSLVAFGAAALNATFIMRPVLAISDWCTLGVFGEAQDIMYIATASCIGFFINQYFSKIYLTLQNFDKYREITGLNVIIAFAVIQIVANYILIGVFAIIPLVLDILAIVLLKHYQKRNSPSSEYISQLANIFEGNYALQEMSFKIGQLRILRSKGRISEEEFMLHLNNILENKE